MSLWRTSTFLALITVLASPSVWADKKQKKDPDAIGERDVGKGLNMYSIEKEIAMGKQLSLIHI